MANISIPEAVTIYARFYQARHGAAAVQLATDRARQLKEKGDSQGCQIWNNVAQEIERLVVTRPSSSAT